MPFGFDFRGDIKRADSFVGYPELAAKELRLPVTNASCPGETSGSFLSSTQPGNGCRAWHSIGAMHVAYTGTQLDFATRFLRNHPRTALVSITLGGNDVLVCAARGAAACAAGGRFFRVLDDYAKNLRTIVAALRGVYRGPLVAVTYYSTDYRRQDEVAALRLLNERTQQVMAAFHGAVADGLAAFRAASSNAGGDACAAHLLAPRKQGGCDIHPSRTGAQVLADALARAYGRVR